MIRNIFLLMLSALCAWSCTDNLPGDEAPTDDRHSLNITVGPKPALHRRHPDRADGTTLPETRAVQTDEGMKWEEGDLVWLYVEFTNDTNETTIHYSALKYAGTTWRYLTGDEANSLELNPNLNGATLQPYPYLRPSRRKHPICGGTHPRFSRATANRARTG